LNIEQFNVHSLSVEFESFAGFLTHGKNGG